MRSLLNQDASGLRVGKQSGDVPARGADRQVEGFMVDDHFDFSLAEGSRMHVGATEEPGKEEEGHRCLLGRETPDLLLYAIFHGEMNMKRYGRWFLLLFLLLVIF